MGIIGLAQLDNGTVYHEALHAINHNTIGHAAYLKNQAYTTYEARAYFEEYKAGYTPSAVPDSIIKLLESNSALTRESGWMQLNEWVGKHYSNKEVHE